MLIIKHWWLLAMRGISSVIFGVYFFCFPDLTLELLFKGFCLYAFIDGAFCLLTALFLTRHKAIHLIFLSIGLLSIGAGAVALYQPLFAMILLFLSVSVWAVFTGILEMTAGYLLNDEIKGAVLLKIAGVISIFIGLCLAIQPVIGFPSVAILIGIFQIFGGVTNLLISFGIKKNRKTLETVI